MADNKENVLMGYIICPVHDDINPSCAVYGTRISGRVRLYCYGCGHMEFRDEKEVEPTMVQKERHPLYKPLITSQYSAITKGWLLDRNIPIISAIRYGIDQVAHTQNAIYIPSYNLAGEETGGEVRFLYPVNGRKIYRTKKDDKTYYADHSWVMFSSYRFSKRVPDILYIVESVIDGLAIISNITPKPGHTIGAFALLGTAVPSWLYGFLNDAITTQMVIVWCDDDAAGRETSADIVGTLKLMGLRVSEIRKGKPYRDVRTQIES